MVIKVWTVSVMLLQVNLAVWISHRLIFTNELLMGEGTLRYINSSWETTFSLTHLFWINPCFKKIFKKKSKTELCCLIQRNNFTSEYSNYNRYYIMMHQMTYERSWPTAFLFWYSGFWPEAVHSEINSRLNSALHADK